jgi:hypothetical protein
MIYLFADTSASLISAKYECCPEIFQSITFRIELIRRSIGNFLNVNSIKKKDNKGKVVSNKVRLNNYHQAVFSTIESKNILRSF